MDDRVKFSDSTLNRGLIIRLVASWSRFTHFHYYSIAVYSRLEAASHVISGRHARLTVSDNCVQFRDSSLNHSGEIRPKAVGSCSFRLLFRKINGDRK